MCSQSSPKIELAAMVDVTKLSPAELMASACDLKLGIMLLKGTSAALHKLVYP